MKSEIILLRAALLGLTALGCSSGGDAQPTMCFGANVVVSEKNDYSFHSTITLSPVTVAPMSNLTFEWGGLTKDFLGRSLNPVTDLDTAIMMIWALPRGEFEADLNADALYTADLVVSPPLNLPLAGETSGQLHNFLVNGTGLSPAMFNDYFDVTLYPPATSTFIIAVQTGLDIGKGIRMLQAFDLDVSSTNTTVTLTNDSTKLTASWAGLSAGTLCDLPREGMNGVLQICCIEFRLTL